MIFLIVPNSLWWKEGDRLRLWQQVWSYLMETFPCFLLFSLLFPALFAWSYTISWLWLICNFGGIALWIIFPDRPVLHICFFAAFWHRLLVYSPWLICPCVFRVICLCAQFEAVLQHGLRKSRGLALTAAAIKQVAGFTSKTEGGLSSTDTTLFFLLKLATVCG